MSNIQQMTQQYETIAKGLTELKSQLYGEKGLGFLASNLEDIYKGLPAEAHQAQ